jgi:hypothetical protein
MDLAVVEERKMCGTPRTYPSCQRLWDADQSGCRWLRRVQDECRVQVKEILPIVLSRVDGEMNEWIREKSKIKRKREREP